MPLIRFKNPDPNHLFDDIGLGFFVMLIKQIPQEYTEKN